MTKKVGRNQLTKVGQLFSADI